MKPTNIHLLHKDLSGQRSFAVIAASAFASLAMTNPAFCADVTLNTSNGIGTSSLASSLSWSNGLAPATGNAYFVNSGLSLRSPADSALSYTFAGDSLTMTGANFIYKGSFTAPATAPVITLNNLTLNGATVNNASNNSTAFVLAGNGITITGTGATTLFSNNASINVTAPITGSTGSLVLSTNNVLGRQVILSGANTYTGNISVVGASGAVLADTGKLAFAIGTSGAFNTVTGTVAFTFNGAFTINLTGASTVIGTTYPLVNTSTLIETFGTTFSIDGWTKVGTAWISPDGAYQFLTSTGSLTRVDPDSDFDGLPDSWETSNFGDLTTWSGGDDPDNDFCTNLQEFTAATNPNSAASFPDSDVDTLPDGWEINYFGSLAQLPINDPDGDYSTNAAEFAAATLPNSRSSFPDDDSDQISDGWEIQFFTTLEACDPSADPDGDLFDNVTEYFAITTPTNQLSSPDLDLDGLPDGWEVRYFLVTGETLAEATAHVNGSADSDSDGRIDRVEYHEGTHPIVADLDPPTLAYWRFEEKTTGAVAYPQIAGAVQDVTGKGNDMITYAEYTAPAYSTRVAEPNITNTSAMNTASLAFVAVDGNRYVCDNLYTPGNAPINSTAFTSLTVEASFRTTRTGLAQGIIGKGGNPTAAATPYQAPFTLKLNAANQVVAGLVDGATTAREIVSTRSIAAGSWYSTAVTVSPTTLSLWLKAPGDAGYVLEGTLAINGAWSASAGSAVWVIGQTEFNAAGNFGGFDSFTGDLDEIRISSRALATSEFLASISADSDHDGMADTWETIHFGNLTQTADGDDDGDGTTNLAEYRLGLIPNSGSSLFASSLSGSTLTWPSANGLVFVVQRSDSLSSWTNLATVVATGSSATWTDPAPPAGKAFYRVTLQAN
jgi:hypothetical protein